MNIKITPPIFGKIPLLKGFYNHKFLISYMQLPLLCITFLYKLKQ